MMPILYESNERSFTTNGLGRLSDAVECTVTEEEDSVFELYMRYPISGAHYGDLAVDRWIYAPHDDTKKRQPFRIYKISKPLNGVVSVYAEHAKYLLNKTIVAPFSAGSCAAALTGLGANAIGGTEFTFWTDKSIAAKFDVDQPQSIGALLAGQSGSILDVYGKGDYEWDHFTVKLYLNRGSDRNVTLRYGKNITDITADADMSNTYTAIIPFWKNDEKTVMLPERILYADTQYSTTLAKAVDFSSEWEEEPSEEKLRARAQKYLSDNEGWEIKQNIKVSFVQLYQTEEYAEYAPLQRVSLCDTVTVIYSPLDVSAKAKVVKTAYNVLLERYDEIEIGTASASVNTAVSDVVKESTKDLASVSFLEKSIARATSLITGGLGGYVKFTLNADGEPEEILIMDTPDVSTAVNVWRWNKNGLGYSSTGYDGPYRLAITADGHIVADFIDTGTLTANIIKAGVLQDLDSVTAFNLETGELTTAAIYFWAYSTAIGRYIDFVVNSTGLHFKDVYGKESVNITAQGIELEPQVTQFSIVKHQSDPHLLAGPQVIVGDNLVLGYGNNGGEIQLCGKVRFMAGVESGEAVMEYDPNSGFTIYNNTPVNIYSDLDMHGFHIYNASS